MWDVGPTRDLWAPRGESGFCFLAMIWSSRNCLKTPETHTRRKEIREVKDNTHETPCKIPHLRFSHAVLFLEWISSRTLLDVVHTNIIIFADCDYEVVFLSQPGSEILQLNMVSMRSECTDLYRLYDVYDTSTCPVLVTTPAARPSPHACIVQRLKMETSTQQNRQILLNISKPSWDFLSLKVSQGTICWASDPKSKRSSSGSFSKE